MMTLISSFAVATKATSGKETLRKYYKFHAITAKDGFTFLAPKYRILNDKILTVLAAKTTISSKKALICLNSSREW